MRVSLKEYIQESAQEPISESLIGKGFAIGQQRKHSSYKTRLQGIASRIQNTAKRGQTEDEPKKREQLLFSLFFDLGNAIKIYAEMSGNSINVATANMLFSENLEKTLKRVSQHKGRRA